jgi:hypothetical protein
MKKFFYDLLYDFVAMIRVMDMTIMKWKPHMNSLMLTSLNILVLLYFEFAGKQQQVNKNP